MKTTLALLLAVTASGCIITANNTDGDFGFINSSWTFHAVDGTNLGCPAGFDTVEVNARSLDFDEEFFDLFDCRAGAGSAAYPLAAYDVTIAVTSNGGRDVWGHSLTQTVDIVVRDVNIGEDFLFDGGRVIFDWTLVDANNNNATLGCDQRNLDGIKVDLASSTSTVSTEFACGDFFGISDPALAGEYMTTVSAVDSAGAVLGEPLVETVTIGDRNDYQDLGSLVLPIGNPPAPPTP